jgi:hypothetical protein
MTARIAANDEARRRKMCVGGQRLTQREASAGDTAAPIAQKPLSKDNADPRLSTYRTPTAMLVAVIVKPSPRPKLRKESPAQEEGPKAKNTELRISNTYPRTTAAKKFVPTNSAPAAEPENCAANKMPARSSLMCHRPVRVGRIELSKAVPTPVNTKPTQSNPTN